jgi:hypothetical protein
MLTVLSTSLAGAAPIIGGQGAFKYQYMPDLLKAPAGANMVNCHGLVTGAHLASRPKRILRRALCRLPRRRGAAWSHPPPSPLLLPPLPLLLPARPRRFGQEHLLDVPKRRQD